MAVLLAGLTVTALAVDALKSARQREEKSVFERHVERVQADVRRRLSLPADAMYGARGMLAALPTLSREAFLAYVRTRDLRQEAPGTQGLGWVERVRSDTDSGWAASRATEDARPLIIRPLTGQLAARFILRHYVGVEQPEGVRGLDLGVDPRLESTFVRAAHSGQLTLSAWIDTGHALLDKPGFIMVLPVYNRPHPADDKQKDALRGFLIVPLVAEEALVGAMAAADGTLDLEVFDGESAHSGALVFDADNHLSLPSSVADRYAGRSHSTSTRIVLGDRGLTLHLSSMPGKIGTRSDGWTQVVAWVGSLLAGSSALLVTLLMHGNRVIEARAKALSHDVERLAKVAQYTTNAVHVADAQGRLLWINAAHARLSGLSEHRLGQTQAQQLRQLFAQPQRWDELLASAGQGVGARARLSTLGEPGSERWLDCEVQALQDDNWQNGQNGQNGQNLQPQGHVMVAIDVTDLHHTAEALALERVRLSSLLASTGAGVLTIDLRTQQLTVDDAFAQIVGLSVEQGCELGLQGLTALLHPNDKSWLDRESRRLGRGEIEEISGELSVRHAAGHWVTTLVRGCASARDAFGRAQMLVSTHIDITEQKRTQQRWRSRAEMSGDWFWCTDSEHRFTELAESAEHPQHQPVRMLEGVRRDELSDVEPPDEGWAAFHAKLDRHESFKRVAYRTCAKSGEPRWVEIDGRPRFDSGGSFLGYEGVGRDIQERREATDRLRQSLSLVDALFDAVPVPLAVTDLHGQYSRVNRAFADAMGMDAVAAQGMHVGLITDEQSVQLHSEIDRQLLAQGGRIDYEVEQHQRSGRSMDTWISKAALMDCDGKPSGLVTVLVDVSQQRNAVRATQEAKEAAEAANRSKSAFLATMSHEIRTPMNGVLGMAEILLHAELPDSHRQTVQTMHRSARRLLRILDSILDFSKLEADRLELDLQVLNVRSLIDEACQAQRASAAAKAVQLDWSVDPQLPAALMGDSLRVTQVLGNLLSNAIKFSAPGSGGGGRVQVSTLMQGGFWVVEVADNGVGMSEEALTRLFEPFMQAEAATTRRFGGTGLGLAISSRLAALLQGTLSAQSHLGKGSVFRLQLPCEAVSCDGATEPAQAAFTSLHLALQAKGGGPLHVLVAEDEPTNRLVVSHQLGLMNCVVRMVEDGQAALQAWRTGSFDLMITDVHMPDLDGYSLARMIREEEARSGCRRMPILALSADVLEEDARAQAAGIDAYLTKPIAVAELHRALERWSGQSEPRSDADFHEAAELAPSMAAL